MTKLKETIKEFLSYMKKFKSEEIDIEGFEDFEELEKLNAVRLFYFQQTFKKYFCSNSNCQFIKDDCTDNENSDSEYCSDKKMDKDKFIYEILNITAPQKIQKNYPRYNPNNLLILAWSGTLIGNQNCDNQIKMGNLIWLNETFKSKCGKVKKDILITDFWLQNVVKCEPTGSKLEIELKFFEILELIATFLCGTKISDISSKEEDNIKKFKEYYKENKKEEIPEYFSPVIKSTHINGDTIIIAGLSFSRIEGIKLFNDSHYDLFSVFIIDSFDDKNSVITSEDFLSIQGLITPAEKRSEIATEITEEHAKGKALGLIARSYSHNIGSHSLLHIINELESKNTNTIVDFEQLAIILNFSKTRNNLIADIASGISIYSLGMSLDKIFNPLAKNLLLKLYLCATEGIEVDFPFIYPEDDNNYLCDIPFAATGCHAIYSLLENFAKNSAKHGSVKNRTDVSLTIKQEPKGNDYYKITIYDSDCIEEDETKLNQIIDNMNKQIEAAKHYFLWGDKTNLNDSLGQAEMLAWCAFLRSIAFHNIPEEFQDNNILAEYEDVKIDDKLFLGFSFYLNKAIETQIITSKNIDQEKIKSNYIYYKDIDLSQNYILKGNYLLKSEENHSYHTPFGNIDIENLLLEDENKVSLILLKSLQDFSLPNKKIRLYILDNPLYEKINHKLFSFNSFDLNISFQILPSDVKDKTDEQFLNDLYHSDIDAIGIWKRHGDIDIKIIKNSKIGAKLFHLETYGGNSTNAVGSLIDKFQNLNIPENTNHKSIIIENLEKEYKTIFVGLAESALTRALVIDDRDLMGNKDTNELLTYSGLSIYKVGDLEINSELSWEKLITNDKLLIEHISNLAPFQLQKQMPFSIKSLHLSLNARFNKEVEKKDWISFYQKLNTNTPFFTFHTGKGNSTDVNIGCINLSDIEYFTRKGLDKLALIKLCRNVCIKTIKS